MHKKLLLSVIIFLIVLSGCQSSGSNPTNSISSSTQAISTNTAVAENAVKTQDASVTAAVPSQASVSTVPAPKQDSGVVTGELFSTKMNAPLSNIGVYLGEYVYLTPAPGYLISIRQNGSPHTMTDDQGRFIVENVPPGKYPLLAWTPHASHVVPDESGKKELEVTVTAGKVTDLGKLSVEFP
jgi:hypothetical protein